MAIQTRRSFLRISSLIAATFACGTLPAALRPAKYKGPKLGIQLYSLRGYSRDEALKHASEMGFEQVEFYGGMLPLDASDEVIEATKKQVADLGMSISGHGVKRIDERCRGKSQSV